MLERLRKRGAKGPTEDKMVGFGLIGSMDMSLHKLQEIVKTEIWRAAVIGVSKNRTGRQLNNKKYSYNRMRNVVQGSHCRRKGGIRFLSHDRKAVVETHVLRW